MAAPIKGWRLGLMVVLLLPLMHLAAGGLEWWKEYAAAFRYGWPTIRISPSLYWTYFGTTMAWPYGRGFLVAMIDPLARLLLLWGALIPLPYLVLVETMKQAKCRPAHLARGWVYFVPVLCTVALIDEIVPHIPWLIPSIPWTASVIRRWNIASELLAVVAVIWYVRWWWLFTSAYLRLPRARLVLTLMMTVSLLATLGLGMLIDQKQFDLIGSAINFFLG